MKWGASIFLVFAIISTTRAQYFDVFVYQNREHVPLEGDIAYLDNTPFEIVVYMSEPMGMMVSASYNSQTYDLAVSGASFEQSPTLCAGCGMPEDFFNPLKELMIADEGAGYWYYENPNDHRFDDVIPYSEGGFHGYRRIEHLNGIHEGVNVRQMGPKMVYVVFYYSQWNDGVETEIQRKPLVLVFR